MATSASIMIEESESSPNYKRMQVKYCGLTAENPRNHYRHFNNCTGGGVISTVKLLRCDDRRWVYLRQNCCVSTLIKLENSLLKTETKYAFESSWHFWLSQKVTSVYKISFKQKWKWAPLKGLKELGKHALAVWYLFEKFWLQVV